MPGCLQDSFNTKYSSKSQSAVFAAVRIGLVLFIALVAAGVPGFGLFIALIGSLACASLSFIVPALCHLILFKTDLNWLAAESWQCTSQSNQLLKRSCAAAATGVGLSGALTIHSLHN